ncbi:CMF_collapsed_G0013450.mRNA.1.CDS.1 [Saccharomyces cerevisiae]|nr:CMF_collapsed_G0013450.mRNA.1.CDS.1 [Saccharomyces cerevisiae]
MATTINEQRFIRKKDLIMGSTRRTINLIRKRFKLPSSNISSLGKSKKQNTKNWSKVQVKNIEISQEFRSEKHYGN